MQSLFDFASADFDRWQGALAPMLAGIDLSARRTPIGQLVKSSISARTLDAVSIAAYRRLGEAFGDAAGIAAAEPVAVERVIADVTFAAEKAERLVAALRMIGEERPDFCLDFLADLPLGAALGWLERLPGVGRKVAAATLNASTLRVPVMMVDGHDLRVLRRLGFVRPTADATTASEQVTAAMPAWSADDFLSFHVAIKRLGQTICRPEDPACPICPLAETCPSARH